MAVIVGGRLEVQEEGPATLLLLVGRGQNPANCAAQPHLPPRSGNIICQRSWQHHPQAVLAAQSTSFSKGMGYWPC